MKERKIADFYRELKKWLGENALQAFAEQFARTPQQPLAQFTLKDFWESFLLEVLTPFERKLIAPLSPGFRNVTAKCAELSDFTSMKGLNLALGDSPISLFPEPRKSELKELILKAHPVSLKFIARESHAEILQNPNQAVLRFAMDYRLDPWFLARVFHGLGLAVYFSKNTSARAFFWMGQNTPDFDEWYSACGELEGQEEEKAGYRLNLWGELLFEPEKTDSTRLRLGLIPGGDFSPESEQEDFCRRIEQAAGLGFFENIDLSDLIRYVVRRTKMTDSAELYRTENFIKHYKTDFISLLSGNNRETDRDVLLWKILRELLGRLEMPREMERERFHSPQKIFEKFRYLFRNEVRECFYTLALDNQNQFITLDLVGKGLVDRVLVHPREVFATALKARAKTIALLHNHPSGIPEPSIQDKKLTHQLVEAAEIHQIEILDHVIFGNDCYFSFQESGILF